MARSTYIYIVQKAGSGEVLRAFTVKHEAQGWVGGEGRSCWPLVVMRLKDGARHPAPDPRGNNVWTDMNVFLRGD